MYACVGVGGAPGSVKQAQERGQRVCGVRIDSRAVPSLTRGKGESREGERCHVQRYVKVGRVRGRNDRVGDQCRRRRGKGEGRRKREGTEREKGREKVKITGVSQEGRILQVYGVHVCLRRGHTHQPEGKACGRKERKRKNLAAWANAQQYNRNKSGKKTRGTLRKTSLPQERWVGTVARVPGWRYCKRQGGKGSVSEKERPSCVNTEEA